MKKTNYCFLLMLFMSTAAMAQSCGNLLIKDGGKLHLDIRTYSGPYISDPKFMKASAGKKDEMVAAFNAAVLAGTITPAAKIPTDYTVSKTVTKSGDEYKVSTKISGVEYSGYSICRDDTLYIARNRGVVLVGDEKNPYGFAIQGVQVIPMHLKVGDALAPFDDVSFTFPTSTDITAKKRVFSHMETSSSTEFGFATDSRTGVSGFGEYTKTTTNAIYKTIDVDVRQTLSLSSHAIQGVNGRVTGEEEVTLNGVKYKAYILESESWTKSNVNSSYESADEEVAKEQKAYADKYQAKVDKMNVKKQFTNKLGYTVMYSKSWLVPALGNVKTVTYDPFGSISSVSVLTGFE